MIFRREALRSLSELKGEVKMSEVYEICDKSSVLRRDLNIGLLRNWQRWTQNYVSPVYTGTTHPAPRNEADLSISTRPRETARKFFVSHAGCSRFADGNVG
jgi:hypothetical protein